MSQIASFRAKLAPLTTYLDDPNVTEIAVNRPGEVWLGYQRLRHMRRVELPKLTLPLLTSLAEVTASYTSQRVDRHNPLLSATMPVDLREGLDDAQRGGYRVQVVLPPAVEERTIALCIRKPTLLDMNLADYGRQGAFATTNVALGREPAIAACGASCYEALPVVPSEATLRRLYRQGDWAGFLRAAVQARKNIVISAGTFAGKTALLNALLKEIPAQERVVTIEDTREIRPPQRNCLHLLYSRGGQGEACVTPADLLEASLRLTPDRAIMGELRGAEAYAYLELLNSGHDGSITTVHADSPALMYERLAQMVMRFGSTLGKAEIVDYARALIDVVVQLRRDPDGRRYVSEIRYEAAKGTDPVSGVGRGDGMRRRLVRRRRGGDSGAGERYGSFRPIGGALRAGY